MKTFKAFILFVLVFILLTGSALGGALADRLFVIKPLDYIAKRTNPTIAGGVASSVSVGGGQDTVVNVAEKVSPAVVTVSITTQPQTQQNPFFLDPFGFFGGGGAVPPSQTQPIKQDIGSGFIVDKGGLIVTNKHVVSDTTGKYRIITADNKEYDVVNIYRDPANDLAIIKVNASLPSQIEMGDSSNLKVGQSVIAIGTALGEFRHTVTTGVISGLGRGINAGDTFGGFVEKLDNVIQTDAAINPGNSGGPLLNSAGQVIGVNTAVAQGAQNIGFAIPINVIKDSLQNFDATGKFSRPFVGVQYRMISKDTALLNDVAAGAYVVQVVAGSSADKAGIKQGDIITKVDGVDITQSGSKTISEIISKHKVGDKLSVDYIRSNQKQTVSLTLQEAPQQ